LSTVDHPTLAEDAVYARCFQAEVILDVAKIPGTFLGRRPTDLILCLDGALLI